ncbi:hypothetical protein Tco_1031147 [Tanacetum coccineum]|uniref:Uncharacterized protein n=1 Tax=Tanacetum coccineum TaxID=301880 RepID=A0ABQ5G9J9_9ASTR
MLSEAQGVSLQITSGVRVRTMYYNLYLGGKALVERENVGFDLTKFDLCPSFIKDLTAKGVDLCMADSHTGNHREDDFIPLETIRRFLAIDAKPITIVHPSEFAENISDSDDAPSKMDEVTLIGRSKLQNSGAEFPSAKELKDFFDFHWVVAHVTPSRTCKLISVLSKARASCDAIREREVAKDMAYAKLEGKCNEALYDIEKNPFVLDMRSEIKNLQGQVDKLHSEYSRLFLEEKKWVNYEQTLSVLRLKIEATRFVCSDEMGLLVARLVKVAMFHVKCTAFEKVADLKEPFILENILGYRPSSRKEFD